MLLSRLLSKIKYTGSFRDRNIGNVFCDSRLCSSDSLFVCIKGFSNDGHEYARAAYENGCRAFVGERIPDGLPDDCDFLLVNDSRVALAQLSCAFFGDPSNELTVIGITGTKGKTTTALMIKQVLDALGVPCGYIGSNGIEWGDEFYNSVNTTPESTILQKYLRKMVDSGMRAVVIEVSSQALSLNRVLGTSFDIGVFTNFSPDHIGPGEHASIEDYFSAKKSFFDSFCKSVVIANADDPKTPDMLADCEARRVLCSVGSQGDICADSVGLYRDDTGLGMRFLCRRGERTVPVTLGMPGEFNIHNAIAAIAVLEELGISLERAAEVLPRVKIAGRFEVITSPRGACFVIDYAHNGVSLASVLKALRAYSPNRLICLFGSVGGRTQIRRVQMGRVAAELADLSILTSDNPDFENPERIIDDIAFCYTDPSSYVRIADRAAAIRYAYETAREGDIVLLAGKGHERYQTVCGIKKYFSETDVLFGCIAGETLKIPDINV